MSGGESPSDQQGAGDDAQPVPGGETTDAPTDAEETAPGQSGAGPPARGDRPDDVPDWDDEYVDRVADRLMYNYDLERDKRVEGQRFTLYGEMEMHHQKHFLHPALSFAHHDSFDHVFATRIDAVTVADLESLVSLGHDVAEDWIDANEEHYATELTFAVVTDAISDTVREFVTGFRERTMIKKGYYGHYEINLVVVAPERTDLVASEEASQAAAFRLWDGMEADEKTFLGRLRQRLLG